MRSTIPTCVKCIAWQFFPALAIFFFFQSSLFVSSSSGLPLGGCYKLFYATITTSLFLPTSSPCIETGRISRSFPGTLADWSVRIMPPRGKRGGRKALEKLENVTNTETQPKTTTKPVKRGRGRPAGKAKENRKMEEQATKKRKQNPPPGGWMTFVLWWWQNQMTRSLVYSCNSCVMQGKRNRMVMKYLRQREEKRRALRAQQKVSHPKMSSV